MPLPQIWKYVAQFHQPHCNRARFVKHTVKLQQPQIVSATLEASAFQSRALQWANLPQRVTGRQVYLRNSSTKFARKVGSMIHRHDSFKKIRLGNPHGKILYISTNLSFASYEFDGFRRISTDFDGFRQTLRAVADGETIRVGNPHGKILYISTNLSFANYEFDGFRQALRAVPDSERSALSTNFLDTPIFLGGFQGAM